MPQLALAICVLWFVSLFLLRTILQWRRTGSTGIKGFHGGVGSLPWIAGASLSLGLLLAPLASLGAIFGWPGGALVFSSTGVHIIGAACALAGIVGALTAQLSMGDSWRVGVDETERTALVTTGLFAWMRNPIFSFVWLSMFGLLLLVPNFFSALAGVLAVLGIELQVRSVEEPYLQATHGSAYRDYSARVGRFVPSMGRLRLKASSASSDACLRRSSTGDAR